jgi:tetratricopeptide (TPR) repeat protein
VVDDTAFIGLPIRNHLLRLRGMTLVPFEELIEVQLDSPMYTEDDRKPDFYAQSWALTHYLLLGDSERRRQLEHYVTAIGNGVPEQEAFRSIFGSDLEQLEREVRNHLRSPRFPYLESETAVDVDSSMSIHEMSPADVLYRLGDLLSIQSPERPEVGTYFEAALEADPKHSQTLTAVALSAENRADWETAAEAYERAVRADPENPIAQFHWGEFLSRRRGDPEEAIAALSKAVELRPSFAPAWDALANLYFRLGESSQAALAAAETAHRLDPANAGTTHNLFRLYLRLDLRDRAAHLIESSLQSNRRTAGEAWMALLQSDLLRARELLQEDQPAAATARLDTAASNVAQAEQPEIIEEGIDRVRTLVAEHRGSKIYDRAFEEYENGNLEAARTLLEQALAELPAEGPVTASCRHLLDVIDNPEKYAPPPPPLLSPTPEEIERFNTLLAARDLEGAARFLRKIRDSSTGSQTRWIDGKIEELQRALDYNLYVDGYNEAVDLFNEEKYSAAIEVLDELLRALPAGPQAQSAKALRNEARELMAAQPGTAR